MSSQRANSTPDGQYITSQHTQRTAGRGHAQHTLHSDRPSAQSDEHDRIPAQADKGDPDGGQVYRAPHAELTETLTTGVTFPLQMAAAAGGCLVACS